MNIDILIPDLIEVKHICAGNTFMTTNAFYMVTTKRENHFITAVNLETGEFVEFPFDRKVKREAFKVVRL